MWEKTNFEMGFYNGEHDVINLEYAKTEGLLYPKMENNRYPSFPN